MSKVAKIVCVSLMTRVIVDENATDEEIVNVAKDNFKKKIEGELLENLEEIFDDEEIPFGEGHLDVYYQPDLEHVDVHRMIMNGEFNSFDVFRSKEKCREIFPFPKIIEYFGNDIENPNFVDNDWQ